MHCTGCRAGSKALLVLQTGARSRAMAVATTASQVAELHRLHVLPLKCTLSIITGIIIIKIIID